MIMTLREKAHHIVDALSEKKIGAVVDFLEYLKIKEELEATHEILDDQRLVAAVRKGMLQYEQNELVALEDAAKYL
jgi:hypothetical protein